MSQTTYIPKFSFLHWIKRCKEPSCPQSPGLELWRTLDVPDWGFGSWSWWGGVYIVPKNLYSEIQLFTLNKKVQRTPMSLKSWCGVVEDSGGSWPGFWFLIMIGIRCPWPHNSVNTSISPNGPQLAELLTTYGPCDIKRDGQTNRHCYFVDIDGRFLTPAWTPKNFPFEDST